MSALIRVKVNRLIDEYCIKEPDDIKLQEIANAENLIIVDENLENCLGKINFSSDCGIISVSNKITSLGQKRFVIAHEMGHFYNEKASVIKCSENDIFSSFNSPKREQEASLFASEFLMPRILFHFQFADKILNSSLIFQISNYFNVSLSAAALRYISLTSNPAAVVFSSNKKVAWSSINPKFPFSFIPPGYLVNKNSYAYDFFEKGIKDEDINQIPAAAWFWNDNNYKKNFYLKEQNIYMPNLNSVLTLLQPLF